MIYHDFQGLKLSALGMGTMRLPVMEGDDSRVDEAAAKEMLAATEEAVKEAARKCPYCKSVVEKDATRCPHCTSKLEGFPEINN